ncbi:hypothetical protein D9615_008218 [Tricholomella constricta]|uniref:Uncharacterized protein n=1 Tax=Tricholomella constricta TaxID=117010 RepID=A0A8H5H398_9AGAR|nr:hypothetical protein D9615_008218 [Tricholomella constricta]
MMLKQSFYLLKIPARNYQKSSDDHKARYALSEGKRNDTFRSSLREFQREFAEEERIQAVGERARGEEFDKTLNGFSASFEANQQRRDRSFLEADVRQEEIFQKNEAAREAVFSEGQRSREAAFKNDQEMQGRHSEWHGAARTTLLLQGRQSRKDACAAIDAALVDQFNKLLRTQEESFVSKERQRDDIFRKIVLDHEKSVMRTTSITNGTEAVGGRKTRFPEPTIYRPVTVIRTRSSSRRRSRTPSIRLQSRHSSRSRSYTPPRLQQLRPSTVNSSPLVFPQPTIVVPHQPRTPSSVTSIDPEEAPLPSVPDASQPRTPSSVTSIDPEEAPLPSVPDASQPRTTLDGKIGDSSGRPRTIKDPFAKQFVSAQQERQQAFLDEEKHRENVFQAAEAAREAAETDRTEVSGQKESDRVSRIQAMFDAQGENFREREVARREGDKRRSEAFDATQQRQSHAFDTFMSQIEKQYEAEGSLEDDLLNHMKGITESLSKRQVAMLDAAREDRSKRFFDAQRRRDEALGVSKPVSYSPPSRSPSYPPHPIGMSMPPPIIMDGMERTRSSSSRSYLPIRDRRRRSFSPAVGFGPAALFRGANVQDSLPVPKLDDTTAEELRQELTFQDLQRRRQLIFERSQAHREEAFETDMQKRRHVFSINEARRQAEFEKIQRTRKTAFEDNENRREDTFKESLRQQETEFRTAERAREADFHQNERARDQAFREAQEERAARFYEKQQDLQKRCFRAEQRRSAELEAWGSALLQTRQREQQEMQRIEEEAFEDAFKWSLGTHVLKNKGVFMDA